MKTWIVVLFSYLSAVIWAQEDSLIEEEFVAPVYYDEKGNVLELESLELPQRSEEDWQALQSGEIVPGSSLMGELALEQLFSTSDEQIVIDDEILEILKQPIDDRWPIEIDEAFAGTYFDKPASSYLIDPQSLLTERELEEREGFLNYHAKNSVIDLYVYLFEGKQDIPAKESPHSVLRNFFADRGDVAVAFYHKGRPDRVQVAYSSRINRGVSTEEREAAILRSQEAAGEKSDAASQFESFLIEMSGCLYAMEKKLPSVTLTLETLEKLEAARHEPESTFFEKIPEGVKTFIATVGFLSFLGILGFFGRRVIENGRVYEFPEAEGPAILDAPHAAGVGGVLSYSSAAQPPSLQKTHSNDYLHRL